MKEMTPENALAALRTQYPRLDASVKRVYGAELGNFGPSDRRAVAGGQTWICRMERGNLYLSAYPATAERGVRAMLVGYDDTGWQRFSKGVELS